MPRFPPSQPFPATASAEGRQFNGAPSPARGEGVKGSGRRGENRELHGLGGRVVYVAISQGLIHLGQHVCSEGLDLPAEARHVICLGTQHHMRSS